jgi:hypothetical protein
MVKLGGSASSYRSAINESSGSGKDERYSGGSMPRTWLGAEKVLATVIWIVTFSVPF